MGPIKRGGFFHSTRSTGPRRIGNGPSPRFQQKVKKKYAANYVKKRKEAPIAIDIEPPHKKQKISNDIGSEGIKLKKNSNPNHIPKRTMPKYSATPSVLPSSRDNDKALNDKHQSAKELMARSAPKKFEQKGKVRFIKPNMPPSQVRNHRGNMNAVNVQSNGNGHNDTYHHQQQHSHHGMQSVQHSMSSTPSTPYKVFPKRPNQIWNTTMIHSNDMSTTSGTELNSLKFGVSFVWRAGCKIDWPFGDMEVSINCSWKKDFGEIEKYMKEIRPGGKKQHLSHHWMLCEIHPYSTDDIVAYGDFCNYYKDMNKVSAAMCKSEKHQHLLYYLCPPDETVLPEQYLDDIFHCKIPKGLLWCLVFVKNLDNEKSKSVQNVMIQQNVSSNVKDPRKRKKKQKKVRKEKKEKSVSLGVEMDSGNLLGMLDNLEDSLKDQANINDDGKDEDVSILSTNSQEY